MPMMADLADAVMPLIASGLKAGARSGEAPIDRSRHFELFACDLVVTEAGRVHLMEVRLKAHSLSSRRLTYSHTCARELAGDCQAQSVRGR